MSSLRDNQRRLKEIISILLKHDIVKGISPEKLKIIIEDLGPTFVKLGQIMSMRSDILPEEYCNELMKLRTSVKAMDMVEVRNVIKSEYNCELEEIYMHFDEVPLGSASIAQAHYATLEDKSEVVLKIQRTNIKDIMARDISLLRKACKMLKVAIKLGDIIDFNIILDEMWNVSQQEMDFLIEAKNAKHFYQLNESITYVTCPKIYDKYTTSKILVMEYIDGVEVDDINKLNELGYDLKEIAEKLCENYIKQIVEDGFFHADPHPGNIKIRDGQIVWIDLGMIGTLTNRDKTLIKNAIKAIATNDILELKDILLDLGDVKGEINHSRLYSDLSSFVNRYIEVEVSEIDLGKLVEELISLAKKHEIAMPKGITMLARGLVTIQGVVANLSPEINIINIMGNYATNDIINELDIKKELQKYGKTLYTSKNKMFELPKQLVEVLNATNKGQLKTNIEFTGSEKFLLKIEKMVNKVVIGIILVGLIIGSSIICTTNIPVNVLGIPTLATIGLLIASILGIVLIFSMKNKH